MEKYNNFNELRQNEKEGRDYQIHFRYGKSGIAVISPHGGGIEPGTTEIADGVAADEHIFYSFEGLKPRENLNLHLTSRKFDEPVGLTIVRNSKTILSIHGCSGEESVVYIGGRDKSLKEKVKNSLNHAAFWAQESPRFPGISPLNICNRSRLGKGVQLEISMGLRRLMFQDLSRLKRKSTTEVFERFVAALRHALSES